VCAVRGHGAVGRRVSECTHLHELPNLEVAGEAAVAGVGDLPCGASPRRRANADRQHSEAEGRQQGGGREADGMHAGVAAVRTAHSRTRSKRSVACSMFHLACELTEFSVTPFSGPLKLGMSSPARYLDADGFSRGCGAPPRKPAI
jgi:hypothetical protein